MKILFIKSHIHAKNLNFILKCKKIQFFIVNSINNIQNIDLRTFDAVISPCDPIDVSKYPTVKFIFGPQFSVFPDSKLNSIKGTNVVYNLLSDWVIQIWNKSPLCANLKLIALPFGVDTELFVDKTPILNRQHVMVYFKHRDPKDLLIIENFLKQRYVSYTVFSYDNKYRETDYIHCLQQSKYCIWIDAHESQGFALQEALSCNVPLLVWNVTSMNQEYGSKYSNLAATTTSYWNDTCGEVFYDIAQFEPVYTKFINKLEQYKPREFIVENLSIDVCENRLIDVVNKI